MSLFNFEIQILFKHGTFLWGYILNTSLEPQFLFSPPHPPYHLDTHAPGESLITALMQDLNLLIKP